MSSDVSIRTLAVSSYIACTDARNIQRGCASSLRQLLPQPLSSTPSLFPPFFARPLVSSWSFLRAYRATREQARGEWATSTAITPFTRRTHSYDRTHPEAYRNWRRYNERLADSRKLRGVSTLFCALCRRLRARFRTVEYFYGGWHREVNQFWWLYEPWLKEFRNVWWSWWSLCVRLVSWDF